jgi:tripartite-type tricarboxylate transporter receptor subunit TctC
VTTEPGAAAEKYPSQTTELVVSCAEGGGTPDTTARLVAQKLTERIGRQVSVKNMPGEGSLSATRAVARAKPDGYTLLFATNSAICFSPILYREPMYDPLQDFTPLVMLASNPFVLAVHAGLAVHSVSDLIRLAREKPRQLSYASFGMGTSNIFMELLKKEAGIELTHVPYPGSAAQVLDDVSAGAVHAAFVDPKVTVERKFERVRYIGLSTTTRHPAVPDIPTIAESGLPSYDANSWVSIVAPARTPAKIAEKLRAAFRQIVASAEFKQYLATNGFAVLDIPTIDEMNAFFRSEIIKWRNLLHSAGLVGVKSAVA